jgi:hypothetical protein
VSDISQLGLARTNYCTGCKARQDTIEAQAAEIKRLRELLAQNIDDEPCWRDHHGYCQAHYLEEDCRVAAARAALGEPTGE